MASILLIILLLLVLVLLLNCVPAQRDGDILLEAKSRLGDPAGRLSDWTGLSTPCNWTGIKCHPVTHSIHSVDLTNFGISGRFPSALCRVSSLVTLKLGENYINGTVSSTDLAPCHRLRKLDLASNTLVGPLPEFEPEFTSLVELDLSNNNFSGPIPPSFGRFPALRVLNLYANFLSGTIPGFITGLAELTELRLALNQFDHGPIPLEIGNLTNLEYIWFAYANLAGQIPASVGNLLRLKHLDLSNNAIDGRIPESIGRLRSVEVIELYANRISGELPQSLGNLTTLRQFDASENALTGELPETFAGLHLEFIGLNDNLFKGEIPAVMATNPNLVDLKIFNNSFSGEIPQYLGRYSDLEEIDVSKNLFSGGIPPDLCIRGSLRRLVAFRNRLTGEIPASLGDCDSLYYVRVQENELSGVIPDRVWGLSKMYHLELSSNRFQGSMASSISTAWNLTKLLISGNNFSGEIPQEICQLKDLTMLDAGMNRFSGNIPACIAGLSKLEQLDLQGNILSGEIPVGSWKDLTELNLSMNGLSGEIPSQLGDLPVLTYLDLSSNRLTGEIPGDLANLKLNIFNLSGNDLTGAIPAGFSSPLYLQSLAGNPDLCSSGTDLGLFPKCPLITSKNKLPSRVALYTVLGGLGLVLLAGLFWFCRVQSSRTGKFKRGPSWKSTSFQRVGLDESEIHDCLTEENLIGSGGSGRVYRVVLKSGQTVAVKRLWTGPRGPEPEREFRAEVETLGRVRHGNIVKLLFCCSAEGFKILVYEYMANGSLREALHGDKGSPPLDWDRRMGIAVGAAQGLAYLHHDCVPAIVHRDVKPSNILLDAEFRAHVGDFGLARALHKEAGDCVTTHVAGSCGYIAPEYAYTLKINEKSDVYSFGVVLLELVTGRKATDPLFGENKDIVKWVRDEVSAGKELELKHVMDPRLQQVSSCEYEEMVRVLRAGLLCTNYMPVNRPSMRMVVDLLRGHRDVSFFLPDDEKQ